jgi:hypothetical protein
LELVASWQPKLKPYFEARVVNICRCIIFENSSIKLFDLFAFYGILMPLSTIIQLWRSVLLVEETRVPKQTTDLSQVTDHKTFW